MNAADKAGIDAIIALQGMASIKEARARATASWKSFTQAEKVATLNAYSMLQGIKADHEAKHPGAKFKLDPGISDGELKALGGGRTLAVHDLTYNGKKFKHHIDGHRYHRIERKGEFSSWRPWMAEIVFKGVRIGPESTW